MTFYKAYNHLLLFTFWYDSYVRNRSYLLTYYLLLLLTNCPFEGKALQNKY